MKEVLQGDGNKVRQALLSKKRLSIDYWLEQWGFIFDFGKSYSFGVVRMVGVNSKINGDWG